MKRNSLRAKRERPHKATLIDEAIGRQIRKRRSMLDISQAELAHRVGVAPEQVQQYESGTNRLSVSRLVAVAQALNAPVGWFFRDIKVSESRGVQSLDPPDEKVLTALLSALAEPVERSKLFAIAGLLDAADGGHPASTSRRAIICRTCALVAVVRADGAIVYDFGHWNKRCEHTSMLSPALCPKLIEAQAEAKRAGEQDDGS